MSMSIQERYAQAIRSTNLTCDVNTTFSDIDVLGAMAFADKRLAQPDHYNRTRPGTAAVSRLLAGDGHSANDVVEVLANRLEDIADSEGCLLSKLQRNDMARACVAWLMLGQCRLCAGNEESRLKCLSCDGTGRISFLTNFRQEHKQLAIWVVQEIARDLGLCGSAALAALAPQINVE